jgi:hypothetical protein
MPRLVPLALALALGLAAPLAPSRAEAQGPLVLGFSGEGGGFVGNDAEGALGGLAVRLGVRPTGLISIYLQTHGLAGVLTAGPEGGSAQGMLWNTAMLGFHFGALELAVGPSIDFAWGCESQRGCVRGSPLFGLDGRVAVHLGSLVISADVHPTWVEGTPVVAFVGGLGWDL